MTTGQKVIKYLALAFAIFLSISILSGICGAVGVVFGLVSDGTEGKMSEYVIENDVTDLIIDINAAELEIKTGKQLKLETNHKYISYELNGRRLEIREKRPFFMSHLNNMKVVLTIPEETMFESVELNTGVGEVTIDELLTDSLVMNLGVGELKAGRIQALNQAEIDGGIGDVTIADGHLHNADIDMGIGELNLSGRLEGAGSIDYGLGETNLTLEGTAEDYRIELDKGIGEAKLENQKMHDDSIYGAGSNRIEIDGGVGELNISFKEICQ